MQNSNQITFVVGAGASKEVDMPIGDELKFKISAALAFKVENGMRIIGGDYRIQEALYASAQAKRGSGIDINTYLKACRQIAAAMPQAESIDNFIDSHRSDDTIAICGKLGIAACILKAERSSKLWVDRANSRNSVRFEDISNTWYTALFRILTQNAEASDIADRFKQVRIITFNYDRCIEHYLHSALQNYFGMSSQQASAAMAQLRIYHPYGHAGHLPWLSEHQSVDFGAEPSSDGLLKIANSLRTFTEGVSSESTDIEEIRESMRTAERIIYLGFAFHELNLQVLYGNGVKADTPQHVYGSAFKISDSNLRIIESDLVSMGGYDSNNVHLLGTHTASGTMSEFSRHFRLRRSAA